MELQQCCSSRVLVDVVYRRDDNDHVVEKEKIILFYYLRNSQIRGFHMIVFGVLCLGVGTYI